MKSLLDTNIVIHREANRIVIPDVGLLFWWLDRLHYEKCLHGLTVQEINKLPPGPNKDAFNAKLASYTVLQTQAPLHADVAAICNPMDVNGNDRVDTLLVNELYCGRVDVLISEDKKVREKAKRLKLLDRVFTIQGFLEKVTAENPELVDYKVLAVKKEYFGNVDLLAPFFDSFREDYPGFDRWFTRKSEEVSYVCYQDNAIQAFLYLKQEGEAEPYEDISPAFTPARRLKIGTFKVSMNGYRLGERFLKIVFDNAIKMRVDEIYVTIFDRTTDQQALIRLLEQFGFIYHGTKKGPGGEEKVYARDMSPAFNEALPRLTFPYFSRSTRVFFVPIWPAYHTKLLPDSILNTESPADFVENDPVQNAIRKVFISRSWFKDLRAGDVIVFCRTGGRYRGVATTVGIVEAVARNIPSLEEFKRLARKRSIFSDAELEEWWNYSPSNRPFIVAFHYAYSLPKRPNLNKLLELGVVKAIDQVPQGFEQIPNDAFQRLLVEAQADDRIIVD